MTILRFFTLLFALLFILPTTGAEDLGRLFFSPQDRQALNQKRAAPAPASIVESPVNPSRQVAEKVEHTESVSLPPPKITGRVIRSSGNNTVWLNHQPQYRRGRQ